MVVVTVSGCTGQNVEGAWRGPFPLEGAADCRIRLLSNRTFDLSCPDSGWVGTGRYTKAADRLEFSFEALTRHEARPVGGIPKVELGMEGRGNRLELGDPRTRDRRLIWNRLPP